MSRRPHGSELVRVHVAGLSSRSHLVYAASYLRHLLGLTTGPIEVVAPPSGGFRGRNPLTPADIAAAWPDDPRLTSGAGDRTPSDAILLSIGVPGIKPFLRRLGESRRRPWVVVCDEGIGTYGTFTTREAALRREGVAGPRATLVAGARTAADLLLADQRWRLYRPFGRGRWTVVDEVADEFRRHATRGSDPTATAVYLTQPWVELGLTDDARYRAHLREVEAACASHGLALQVRPHPVEDPARYAGLDLVTGPAPAELDRRVVDARVVLGGASTALLNLAAVHRVPALRLTMPETDALDAAMSTGQRTLFDTFVPTPVSASGLDAALARTL